jgi:GxxExxY protein
MSDIIYKEESYKIIGSCMEVHKELGCGFLEPVYQEALEIVFKKNGIPYQREKELSIMFCGELLKKTYNADFVCYNKIILELKALNMLLSEHEAQVINYLKTSDFMLGLLVNFGSTSLEYKRIPNKYYNK